MKKVTILGILFIYCVLLYPQNKRGIAYGYHSPNDLEVLSPEISWWYNWSEGRRPQR